jgi:hypothetical protein
MSTKMRRLGALWLGIALLAIAPLASAAIRPESDVVLPWFELDLDRHEIGLATTFSVVNASPTSVLTKFTIYTNWGIPVLEVPVAFNRTETKSIDLGAWIAHGQLPDRTLTPPELAHLHAALTGNKSPSDGLYYGSPFEEGLAVGYITAETLGERPDVLFGDTYNVDLVANFFEAETLSALTHDLKADCKRHGVRFVNEGRLYEGAELIVWSGRRFDPSPTPIPGGERMKVTISIYDQDGNHVQDCHRELIAVETIKVCHLDITPPIGWLDIRTDDPTFILEHLHSTSKASAELHSYCLPESLDLSGPAISLEKRIKGNDADRPRGPKIPVGEQVPFEYFVTNTGTVPLTSVNVTDDTGLQVTCPKTALEQGEFMTCTASTPAVACTNGNLGTASGTAPNGTVVTAMDEAWYEGINNLALTLELLVNDNEADEATGPLVDSGELLRWTLVVTNTGSARLDHIVVSRKENEPATCPQDALDPGQSMTCTAQSLAADGQRHEVGTASGADSCGKSAVATDPAYYFGRRNAPGIEIRKFVGESDANNPPGPSIRVGAQIEWRFLVTNIGNVTLTGVTIADTQGITPVCPTTTLEPGESMICTASSPAVACQQSNTATATGHVPPGERTVTDDDVAHYFGMAEPALALELSLNGDPADEPPGVWIDAGNTILMTYQVSNIGNAVLNSITVSDDHDRTATCPKTTLQPGESMTCTTSIVAVAGTHDLYGSAYGRPACGDPVQANDPAYYRGRALHPSIDIVKMTNGIHAETLPGPAVPIGSTIQWTYLVTNTGNVPLSGIVVTDNREVAVTCPKTALDPGESMTCTAGGIAQACQYSNTATVQGNPPGEGEPVSARDDSFYFGQHSAAIAIDKKTNGEDAAQPPGPTVTVGSTVQWTFVVTNTGDVALTEVVVSDDRAGAVSCPKTGLAVGESMTCTASGAAVAGAQRNIASVTAKPPCGNAVTASDSSHYRGVTPSIRLEKLINGQDADDSAHAVPVVVGASVIWSFVVTNTGEVVLSDIAVTDDKISNITCPKTTLQPGEAMTCTASGIAVEGLDCDTGTATGISPQQATVTSTDSACYTGGTASIFIEKRTNGVDADLPPGPEIPVGATVNWTYIVTNTGSSTLTAVTVTDNMGVTVNCPETVLAPAGWMTCTATGTAVAGQYANIGTATGTPPVGGVVTASDASHYFGKVPNLQGCTPGYWKNHTGSWPSTGYSPGQTVGSVFGMAALYGLNGDTLLQSLDYAGGSGTGGAAEILLRAATAALLNASNPSVYYPREPASVISDVNGAMSTQNRDTMLALAAQLDADNNLGCPLN